jgi:hypothetical protein
LDFLRCAAATLFCEMSHQFFFGPVVERGAAQASKKEQRGKNDSCRIKYGKKSFIEIFFPNAL